MAHIVSHSEHDEMIHDAVLDFYGTKLATCSSDKTIKVYDVEGDSHRLTETLRGHQGPVWSVAWAHPKYGNMLASASYDGKVIIWREQNNQWQKIYNLAVHTASVNGLAWAPHECGCLLVCGSSDGNVSVLELRGNTWVHKIFLAHSLGVNAVGWAPSLALTGLANLSATRDSSRVRKLVTAGSDGLVKIWDWNPSTTDYTLTCVLEGHNDWVRDVAWAPTNLAKTYIASASQDKTVRIWSTAKPSNSEWDSEVLIFDCAVWKVSWSLTGTVLAISTADNRVTLWKAKLDGGWDCVSEIDE